MKNTSSVNILECIDVSGYPWCSSAVMFTVKNGKGTLTHINGQYNHDYYSKTKLMLNDRPIMQSDLPVCPTCSALLAAGYGTENIKCHELEMVRKAVNTEFSDIISAAGMLKPLLELLSDGIYLLADVPHYPTNGENKFFMDIPNKPTVFSAACNSCYSNDFFTAVDSFPAYLYPTQSDSCINEERVLYYMDMLKKGAAPRGIAYHDAGFISALLDGHHKAAAAARLGMPISCLTIIKGYVSVRNFGENKGEYICFAAIDIPKNKIKVPECNIKPLNEPVRFDSYRLINNVYDSKIKNDSYPDVYELIGLYAAELENTELTDELIGEWFARRTDEDIILIGYALNYFKYNEPKKAYRLAEKIIREDSSQLPLRKAFSLLLNNKNEHTEKLFIDYIASHNSHDSCYELAASYWDDQ
ncbi:MAG: hypothetical protein IJ446_05895 [Oscillospiraceae bacterium]|nr:hypothetical protein [Oscillospiraceae bacterium]